jgi:hypothetical protein
MKYLIASIICTVLAALTLWLMGCTEQTYQPFPEGGQEVQSPIGYEIHCQEFPDSVFCEESE